MFGEDPKAAVESFRFPALAAEVTGAAEDPIDGDRRIRNLCGSSAEASILLDVVGQRTVRDVVYQEEDRRCCEPAQSSGTAAADRLCARSTSLGATDHKLRRCSVNVWSSKW